MALTDRLNQLVGGFSRTGAPLPNAFSEDLGERLLECLPSAARNALARRHRRLLIEVDGEFARLILIAGPQRDPLGEVALNGPATLPVVFTELARDPSIRIELVLPKAAILLRPLSFPAQVRTNLYQVIGYEMDRLSPFQAKDVMFDFQPQGNPRRTDRVSLELAICRRSLVEPWIQRFSELGVAVDKIHWIEAWPRANLLPHDQRPRRRRLHLSAGLALWILIVLTFLAAMATPIWQKSRILEGLEADLKRARSQAVAVDELRQELEKARAGSTEVLKRKIDQIPILDLLRELTDSLPDDTWIQNLEFNDGQVDIRGESGQATALIAVLEQLPDIDSVSFKSPVTQVARTGKERFYITFKFTGPGEKEQ
ncbi:Fimbrial assembly family protein [Thiorhodococcus drewsii AZ1]|uniref:Fimbrial assembly family protein n=1 Tax=Thiorhodococcus drewsii AZ1 TaxID=765913 RepID=G2E1M0_9GAMM|nr:PilN domain-containing protein [Thiorhodococcus drewsii]EGV31317.1 Fimbrial assembly family protein [Thiorhodococcus drewsii AZ1]